jgi:transcription termination factor Rho
MSVLDRDALDQSPLADLHAIASELSLDGYRRLRKADLIDAIIERQGGAPASRDVAASEDEEPTAPRRRRGRRGGRAKDGEETAANGADEPEAEAAVETPAEAAVEPEAEAAVETPAPAEISAPAEMPAPAEKPAAAEKPARRRRGAAAKTADEAPAPTPAVAEAEPDRAEESSAEPIAEGVVEVLANGSGFLRVHPPEPSDEDVYVSAAQVKRCELVSGDRISGPRRAPRRSERFASLVRVDIINDRPASEVADSARFDDLPAGFAVDRFRLNSEDPTLKAIEYLTPFGRGSRVAVAGPAQSGKSEALRRLAGALAASDELTVLIALTGVRSEELADWSEGLPAAAASAPLGASGDAQGQAVERVLDQARRLTARGSHVVVIIDSLVGVAPSVARKAMAGARRIVDGGSLTVIAAVAESLGGETTTIVLDAGLTAARRFPALDLAASWTMRPELLVGDGGAELIVRTRAEALERS